MVSLCTTGQMCLFRDYSSAIDTRLTVPGRDGSSERRPR